MALTFTSISPVSGTSDGGTPVTLTGTGFLTATRATIGGVGLASFLVVDDTTITGLAPAGAAGTADVVVDDGAAPATLVAGFLFVDPLAVTSIVPAVAVPAGGPVTLVGQKFTGATGVTFDGIAATAFVVVDDNTITCTAPAHASGDVDVVLTSATETFTRTAGFHYAFPLTLASLSPTSGTIYGSTVVLTGTGFTGASDVTFGGVSVTSLSVVDDNTILVTSPATPIGAVDVVVTVLGVTATLVTGYTYIYPPAVPASVSPSIGLLAGGDAVAITGSGFNWATGVTFHGFAATDIVVVSDSLITCVTPADGAGLVDVVVQSSQGDGTLVNGFTYIVPAAPASVTPNTSPYLDAIPVTILGEGFAYATGVTFDGTAATDFLVVNDGTITCTAPARNVTPVVDVVVLSPFGNGTLAASFTYIGGTVITTLTPSEGTGAGGTHLTITGSGFTGATSVLINGIPAADFVAVDDAHVTCTTLSHAPGVADVQVVGPYGSEQDGTFTFFAPAVIFTIAPNAGTNAGGTPVTITGSGFTGGSGVMFGGAAATSVIVVNDGTVTCVTPAHVAGPVSVTVVSPYGSSTRANGYTFIVPTFPTPQLTGVNPAFGTTLGGTAVTLTGTNMDRVTTITFGGTVATSVVVLNDTTVTCVTPARIAGSVIVTALAPEGFSSLPLGFEFITPPPVPPPPGRIIPLIITNATATPVRAPVSSYPGAIVFDPANGCAVTEVMTTTLESIDVGHAARLLSVVDASQFPDVAGWLVFGFGHDYQTSPVPYLGRASATQLLLDPTYPFPNAIPEGATINLLTGSEAPNGGAAGFYLTGSPAGRVAAAATADDLAAAGIEVRKTILYPGDAGLGNAGQPTRGAQRLSDVVTAFAGDDVDTEVEAARNS